MDTANQTYDNTVSGIRQAVADHQAEHPLPPDDIVVVEAEEGRTADDSPQTLREAAKSLSDWRRQQAERSAEIDAVLNGTVPEADQGDAEPDEAPQQPQPQPQDQAAEWERQQAMAHLVQMQLAQQQVITAFAQQFPEIQSEDDLHALYAADPERGARAIRMANESRTLTNRFNQLNAHLTQHATQQFKTWAGSQDAAFHQKHPEFKNEQAFKAVKENALSMLQSEGFSNADLVALWEGKGGVSLRDARLQSIIADATRFRMARASKIQIEGKPLPPVVRPGTRAMRDGAVPSEIQELRSKKSMNVREAAKLLSAERRLASR